MQKELLDFLSNYGIDYKNDYFNWPTREDPFSEEKYTLEQALQEVKKIIQWRAHLKTNTSMFFSGALVQMKNNKHRVYRKSKPNNYLVWFNGSIFQGFLGGTSEGVTQWEPTQEDILAGDWSIVR